MDATRRCFLKVAGASALAAGTLPLIEALAAQPKAAPNPKALKAKRWGMVVDMSKCKEGCTDCMAACHAVHNVPSIPDPKREIKWIWQDTFEHVFPGQEDPFLAKNYLGKPFMLLCNHCANPPCVRVCPTKATFKRPEDGIVMMDFHRCIGCRYCMAACPFGARSFNWGDPRLFLKPEKENPAFPTRTKGVVEKCSFCVERLSEGLIPACVEACKKNGALIFGDLEDPNSEVRKILAEKFSIRRKAELGTQPSVYYIV